MRRSVACLFALLACGLLSRFEASQSSAPAFPLRVQGTRFVDSAGRRFEWRGMTAFRVLKMIASGDERGATRILDWATEEQLTVLRVLAMAPTLFDLTPERGRAALPRLLDMARARGLAIELVVFADTYKVSLDYSPYVTEIGRIAHAKGNAFIEMTNEPGHPTQDRRLHDPAFVAKLARLLPEPLIVALGSVEYGEGFTAGDYATFHFARGHEWEHVFALSGGAQRVTQLKKPIISDEPIGAGPKYERGRRDNVPARFGAAAALTRFTGMGATFHYDGGVHTRLPQGTEVACFRAWKAGLALVPDDVITGEFVEGEAVARVATAKGARRTYARVSEKQASVLLVDPAPSVQITWSSEWRETRRNAAPGTILATAVRARIAP
jgi:hypothetical protein